MLGQWRASISRIQVSPGFALFGVGTGVVAYGEASRHEAVARDLSVRIADVDTRIQELRDTSKATPAPRTEDPTHVYTALF